MDSSAKRFLAHAAALAPAERRTDGTDADEASRPESRRGWRLRLPQCPRRAELELGPRTLVMGILNVTPDSFSDGGRHLAPAAAIAAGLRMEENGADLIDVGGESTRPGAEPVSTEEEKRRVLPVVEALAARLRIPVSIDSYKAEVVRAALAAGAGLVNDISGLRFDPELAGAVAQSGAPIILMHIQGTPRDMQRHPNYQDLLGEIRAQLAGSLEIARQAGIDLNQTIVDPGIGFGKTHAQNLTVIARLAELKPLGRPILIGVSRKAFIGTYTGGAPVSERLYGTAAAAAAAILNGAQIIRVHDLPALKQVAMMSDALRGAQDNLPREHFN